MASKNNKSLLELVRANFREHYALQESWMEREENLQAVVDAAGLLSKSLKEGGKVLTCGNGGSMCDAMHLAEELSGRFRNNRPALAALALSDASYLTCVGNDYGFDQVFARGVEALGQKGDVLVAISTSGNSANVVEAARVARAKGLKVLGLTGKGGGMLASLCDAEVRALDSPYADRAQELHIQVIHSMIQLVESQLGFG